MIDKIIARYGTEMLVQLTNHSEDSSATTINEDRLQAAIDDATGDFINKTGIVFNEDDNAHVSILIPGVFYKLESYKDTESVMVHKWESSFYAALNTLVDRKSMLMQTDSEYEPGDTPLDKSKKIWNARRR